MFTEDPSVFDPRKYLGAASTHKMKDVFGSANKA